MSKLVFVRHAATDLAGTFCGHLDPPLNAAGEHQLATIVQRVELLKIDAVYSSDLQRARATADAIARSYAAPMLPNADLREIAFGDWEGKRWAEIEADDPSFARRWSDAFPELTAPGGEPYAAFQQRVLAAVSMLRAGARTCAAVVTHGGVMRVVLEELGGVEAARAWELTREYGSCFVLSAGGDVEVCR